MSVRNIRTFKTDAHPLTLVSVWFIEYQTAIFNTSAIGLKTLFGFLTTLKTWLACSFRILEKEVPSGCQIFNSLLQNPCRKLELPISFLSYQFISHFTFIGRRKKSSQGLFFLRKLDGFICMRCFDFSSQFNW